MTPTTAPSGTTDARLDLLGAWLRTHAARYALDLATLASASSDASFRRYYRIAGRALPDARGARDSPVLSPATSRAHALSDVRDAQDDARATLIAVDAPPPEKCREFAQVAQLLADAGVHVPRVLEADFDAGLMLVTDLGTESYLGALTGATHAAHATRATSASLAGSAHARTLMRDALDALIRWQCASRKDVLPLFDDAFLHREMALLPEWYLTRHLGRAPDDATHHTLERTFALLAASARAQPQGFMLRDFMPRNLMVATSNPGVLDFQDAVYGPLTYDVVSLLRDAFISWDEAFELDCFAYYWEQAKKASLPVDADFGEFYRQLEWMGLQRHIKVLGLFCRIHYRDGKSHYLADLPRFLRYAGKVAHRYPPLAPFARLLDEWQGAQAGTGYTF